MLKKIENPDISGVSSERLATLSRDQKVKDLVLKSFSPYVHWEKIKYWPIHDGITHLELWASIKSFRNSIFDRTEGIVKAENGLFFSWTPRIQPYEQFLHEVDMKWGGNRGNPLLIRDLIMEEAIASSQLEGAHSSRKEAKKILLEGKKPKNNAEQMIVNNYEAMRLIEAEYKDKKLSEEFLFSLHKTLTKETLNESEIARYRKDADEIIIGDDGPKNEVYHIPPKELFVKQEMKRLIAYANNELPSTGFTHPVIKAIIIHFWIGYLHPFVDGNGRLARALFYWYLLRQGYWMFIYFPLSKAIKDSPGQYRDAYMYTEQDDNDLTYFIEYNIKKLSEALRKSYADVARKEREDTKIAKIAREKYRLNDRQIQLLRYYYKNKDATTSVTTHLKIYEISKVTAMKDLRDLERQGFLSSQKSGVTVYYSATKKIELLFDEM